MNQNVDKDYLSLPLGTFLSDLAEKSAVPSAGSTAALTATIGVAMGQKVLRFTLSQPQAAGQETRLKALLDEFQRAGDMFRQLIREDMAAVDRFMTARRGSEEERRMAAATLATVPMEIMVLTTAVMARLDEIKALVSTPLMSELRAAAIVAYAAARIACTVTRVNLRELADRKEADRLETQLDLQISRAGRHRNNVVHFQAE